MDVVLFSELELTGRGLGSEDEDVEICSRHVKFEVIGCHLKRGFLVGDWIYGSVAQES